MDISKKSKSRRGFVIENAVFFMLIIFSFCFLITTLVLLGHYQIKIDNSLLQQRVAIDQIGEDFVAKDLKESYDGYSYEVTDEKSTLKVWRQSDESKKTVLLVQVDNTGEVTRWVYSEPQPSN